MTTIDADGVRKRHTSDIMAATLVSQPYFEQVAIPDDILDELQDEDQWP